MKLYYVVALTYVVVACPAPALKEFVEGFGGCGADSFNDCKIFKGDTKHYPKPSSKLYPKFDSKEGLKKRYRCSKYRAHLCKLQTAKSYSSHFPTKSIADSS